MPLPTTFRHRPEVVYRVEETSAGAAWVYRAACTCGETGPRRARWATAHADLTAHLAEVAPPAEEQCRDRAGHGTQPWDACVLCSGQDALF
ncbi:hypothetical protein GCM10027294_53360 [Marinactinospora endophytica]